MGKKVKEYKSGDFIFAKVKGYPAWPARVQKLNGKKYFVYFYGTGETANLPPNMIFDYAENKDKFLTKTVKRRDFNDGVKQIEYDFANNVPLEQVIGVPVEGGADAAMDDTANDSAIDATMDESAADATANDTTVNDTADDTNTTQNDAGGVEDSDEAGTLVIDEGAKAPGKGKKSKAEPAKTPAKETPKAKEPKTPRGKAKKEEAKEKDKEEDKDKVEEELVSRSGRKIRPKRYIDEQTEENATLPSPAQKRRRGASPVPEKEKVDNAKVKTETGKEKNDKTFTQYNTVKLSDLEGLKAPFKPADEEKDNILIAYLPNGTYVGVKLFQSRPNSFKSETSRLQWDKQAAANAITLKTQLERDQITPQSVQGQLVMSLNLTDEEKAALDKERDTEEKKSRVNFLKTEMKLIELDAKIKSCLCLERADTELCLTLLDELLTLETKPLMLLKHPTCLETVKRMRAYVGNTPSWDLSEADALQFSKQAHKIRKKADLLYKNMKGHFHTPDGLSFWEFFSERVRTFKEIVANHNAGELLEMVHEPLELDHPNTHSMKSAIEKANHAVPPLPEDSVDDEDKLSKKKGAAGKSKKKTETPSNATPSKSKRQSSRNKPDDGKSTPEDPPSEPQKPAEESTAEKETEEADKTAENDGGAEKSTENGDGDLAVETSQDSPKEPESAAQEANQDVEMADVEKGPEKEQNSNEITENEKEQSTKESDEASVKNKEVDKSAKGSKTDKNKDTDKPSKEEKSSKKDKKSKEDKTDIDKGSKEDDSEKGEKNDKSSDKATKDAEKSSKDSDKTSKDIDKSSKDNDKNSKDSDKNSKDSDKSSKGNDKSSKNSDKSSKDDKSSKESDKSSKDNDKSSKDNDKSAKAGDKSPKTSKEDKHSKESDKREKRSAKDAEKSSKDSAKNGKEDKSDDKEGKDSDEKEKQDSGEPRAKRSRESKKTEPPPPRSPAKRKSKV